MNQSVDIFHNELEYPYVESSITEITSMLSEYTQYIDVILSFTLHF